jgi:isoleucyl-tRNA synthetase|tara:strand:+ start:2567 stop:5710 length:3144 start_codon:yes stop_codon:yes gene_type:complete
MIDKYDATKLEPEILDFWKQNNIYGKAKEKNKGKKKFYFLDGPPYTSGKVHLGTAWNKSLKDSVLRYKRMQGFDVWDRAGYDMHGLPTEQAVEKKLKLKNKDEIPNFGVANFVNECREFAISNMLSMNKDFRRIGVWMDFDNPYQSIENTYMEGEWWLIKKAFENKRLYEGEKTMHWCASCATSLAKHELVYEKVKDDSIFVKFPVKDKENEFLIIWTTTPWTIPFNLGVMVNPNLDYVKAKVDNEVWIVAKALTANLITDIVEKQFTILEEIKGSKLEGIEYTHPFENDLAQYKELKEKNPKVHTVVLSEEYVDTISGSGLVHMAPGCGPEDYEIGRRNDIPPFNTLTEQGIFNEQSGFLKGFKAKTDDSKITEEIKKKGALAAQTKIEHDYAHCWRCKNPIIYRTTTQWFFRIEDLKEKMRELNKDIKWVPDFAGSKNFDNWLLNLRDNGITRQRYWGTPLPIWKCRQCNDFVVVGSIDELKKLAGHIPEDLHKPWIDEVKIKCKCGNDKERIPDILDVWIDAGSASWNCLDYPRKKDLFEKLYPADFILEGTDQIRGWFNLLFVASMVAMDNASFKSAYMHGFINDAQGRKMSKSLGNYILPHEVIMDYGADTLRFYMIGGTAPGIDINYNFDDMKVKHKNLTVLWNLHKYVIEMGKNLKIDPAGFDLEKYSLDIEERYIFSKLNSTIKSTTSLFDDYRLNEIPWKIEELFLALSRTYIQLTRDKASMGSDDDKKIVFYTVFNVLLELTKLFATIAPFIAERIYQNLKNEFKLKEESIHFYSWPKHSNELVDKELESSMSTISDIVQSSLALREKIQLGVRWPVKELVIAVKDNEVNNAVEKLAEIIKKQVNVKGIKLVEVMPNIKVNIKADYSKIGPDFGDKAPKIIAHLTINSPETVLNSIKEKGKYSFKVDNEEVSIVKEHLIVTREVPLPYEEGTFKKGSIYINREMTDELEAEGFAREIMRRVQSLRKKAGLQKSDSISLFIRTDDDLKAMLKDWNLVIKEKVGASQFRVSELQPSKMHAFSSKEKVKGKEFELYLEKI